jgi:hypothetical protein
MIGVLLSTLAPILGDTLKRVIPDKNERDKIQAEMTVKILEQEASIMTSMKDVMVADSSSSNKLTSAARPIVVYWCLGFVTFLTVLGVFSSADPALAALERVPNKLWDLITVGIGAFSITRGLEKSVTAYRKGD